MLNINKVVVAGHVGSVEIRYTSSGDAVIHN
jgi:single-stranded DNA-binding protein